MQDVRTDVTDPVMFIYVILSGMADLLVNCKSTLPVPVMNAALDTPRGHVYTITVSRGATKATVKYPEREYQKVLPWLVNLATK